MDRTKTFFDDRLGELDVLPQTIFMDRWGNHGRTFEEWEQQPRWRRTAQRWLWRTRLLEGTPPRRFFWQPTKVERPDDQAAGTRERR